MELARSAVFVFSLFFVEVGYLQMELSSPLYSYFLIFVQVGNLPMELSSPAVFLFSYFCAGRQSSNGAS